MKTREEYAEDLKRNIDEWTKAINEAEQDIKDAAAENREQLSAELDQMREYRDRARAQLEDMSSEAQDNWETNREKAISAWNEISDGFARAWKKLS